MKVFLLLSLTSVTLSHVKSQGIAFRYGYEGSRKWGGGVVKLPNFIKEESG